VASIPDADPGALVQGAPSGGPSRRSCERRCSQAVPDFLSTTDVGRLVPAEEDAEREASEWELEEERGEGGGAGAAEELGAEEELPMSLPTLFHSIR